MKEEKIQEEEGMKLEEEEASIEEAVTQADEGELLPVKRVLFSFQRIAEEPKEDPFHRKEDKTIIPTPLSPFQTSPNKSLKNPNPIKTFPHL